MKLSVISSALQIFEQLHMWEDMIDCYILLGGCHFEFCCLWCVSRSPAHCCCVSPDKISRAKKLVQARLDVSPTPRLWCVLGALLNEDWPYERAWDVSGHK